MWIKLSPPQGNIVALIRSNGSLICSQSSLRFSTPALADKPYIGFDDCFTNCFLPKGRSSVCSSSIFYDVYLGRCLPRDNVIE